MLPPPIPTAIPSAKFRLVHRLANEGVDYLLRENGATWKTPGAPSDILVEVISALCNGSLAPEAHASPPHVGRSSIVVSPISAVLEVVVRDATISGTLADACCPSTAANARPDMATPARASRLASMVRAVRSRVATVPSGK